MPRGAEGVTFLPYLQGERTPHRDASARGAMLGLSLAHTRAHVTRAVLEGVTFALRDSLTILADARPGARGTAVDRRRREERVPAPSAGRDLGVPCTTVNREEGPAYGAALLAAVGAGAFPDLASAAAATLSRGALEHPDPSVHLEYEASLQTLPLVVRCRAGDDVREKMRLPPLSIQKTA